MRTRFGACVARARLQARFGRPMPTKTVSPSSSSRAAATAMSSALVAPASIPIVHPDAELLARAQPIELPAALLDVLGAIVNPANPLVQVSLERGRISRHRFP